MRPLIPIHHHELHSSIFPFLICNFFFQQWEICVSLSKIHLLVQLFRTHKAGSEWQPTPLQETNSLTRVHHLYTVMLVFIFTLSSKILNISQSNLVSFVSSPLPSVCFYHPFVIQLGSFVVVHISFLFPPQAVFFFLSFHFFLISTQWCTVSWILTDNQSGICHYSCDMFIPPNSLMQTPRSPSLLPSPTPDPIHIVLPFQNVI